MSPVEVQEMFAPTDGVQLVQGGSVAVGWKLGQGYELIPHMPKVVQPQLVTGLSQQIRYPCSAVVEEQGQLGIGTVAPAGTVIVFPQVVYWQLATGLGS